MAKKPITFAPNTHTMPIDMPDRIARTVKENRNNTVDNLIDAVAFEAMEPWLLDAKNDKITDAMFPNFVAALKAAYREGRRRARKEK